MSASSAFLNFSLCDLKTQDGLLGLSGGLQTWLSHKSETVWIFMFLAFNVNVMQSSASYTE